MFTRFNPYLNFLDTTRQAMEFYQSIFGGKLDISTFQEAGMTQDAVEGAKIMHAMLEGESGVTIMASDTPNHIPYEPGRNVSLSLSGDDGEKLRGYWNKLSEGGTVEQPLVKAPWGDEFGMLTDKHGIRWMVNITPNRQA